ncbi:hypothetical protein [Nonomuraea sp. NPDC050783]|uniref:hypothetical protein n=1 Tax=Nonomuraea sp. NPDC050783 TaxID=3154634 RepID=UPI0034651407
MQPVPRHEPSLPAAVCADLSRLLDAGWEVTGVQVVSGETGPAHLVSASSGEWSLLSAYPRDAAAEWSASLYRGADEYVVLDRDEFAAAVAGTGDDLARAWAGKEHQLLVPDEHEDGPVGDGPAYLDGVERTGFGGFMTIRGSSALNAELRSRRQLLGRRFVITAGELLELDEGCFIEIGDL